MSVELPVLLGLLGIFLLVAVALSVKAKEPAWKEKVQNEVTTLRKKSRSNDSDTLQHTLIKADRLLDFALKHASKKGTTLGERLKHSKSLFQSRTQYDKVWQAHKTRNKLVHEISVSVNHKTLKNHISILLNAAQYVARK